MGDSGIGWAVKELRNGGKVRRLGWNGKGMWLELQVPDTNSKMTLPYVYMSTAQGSLVPVALFADRFTGNGLGSGVGPFATHKENNLDITGLLYLVIWVVILGVVFYVLWWFVGYVGLPEPFNKVARVLIGLIALVMVLYLLVGIMPFPKFR